MNIEYFLKNWKNIDKKDVQFSKAEWMNISKNQNLSEGFIEEYKNCLNWYHISRYQILSELFIKKHLDKLDCCYISCYQKLSDIFILEMYKYIDYNVLRYNKNIKYILFQSKLGRSLLIL